jgi:hypothetical protein
MSSQLTTTEIDTQTRESAAFELLQRQAKMFAASSLVPKEFQGNVANCAIALDIAKRLGAAAFMVFQNIDIIHGRPSFRATFLIAMVNAAGRFEPLQFKMDGTEGKPDRSCIAWTKSKADGATLEGPKITLEMAKAEGWSTKNGSKWLTMPELMLRYRAAAFFARLYAPDITLGMMTAEEIADIVERDVTPKAIESKLFKPKTPAPEECPHPPPYKSLAQSPATADSPATYGDGRQVQQNESAESFSLDGDEVPLVEQVTLKLVGAGLKWSEVHAVMADNGLADAEFVPLNEAPSDVLSACLAQFDAIVNIIKGVKP